ncbi:hypothetical protein TWF694_005582 [Orbilia ellipsospora]|uniref:Uncharacterized protein n=1 Tax=Orbilia ellipsospora TaxID=2528407 RepID=A0AAV9WUL8_9PEZI
MGSVGGGERERFLHTSGRHGEGNGDQDRSSEEFRRSREVALHLDQRCRTGTGLSISAASLCGGGGFWESLLEEVDDDLLERFARSHLI